MKLVIVESPAKCTTIKRYLGDNYIVMASLGHIRDLATSGKDGLGVDVKNDFQPTYIVNKEQELGDIAKVAFMPKDLDDTLKVLAILSHCENTIAISMSDLGSYTRVMASKFNSPITFAAGRDVTAPGQIDIETMRALLNMDLNIMD